MRNIRKVSCGASTGRTLRLAQHPETQSTLWVELLEGVAALINNSKNYHIDVLNMALGCSIRNCRKSEGEKPQPSKRGTMYLKV
jgi:hypothetical protein